MNVVNYVGWAGHGNLGDEALFLICQKLFDSYRLVPNTEQPYSGITVLGGGTLLPLWLMFLPVNRYSYAFGVGVRNPVFWGAFPFVVVEQTRRFKFRLLGVRGNLSRSLLKSWGVKSEVIGDPCLILEPQAYKKKGEKIAINVGVSPDRMWCNEERVFKETVELCQLLKKTYELVLLPFWNDDVPFINKISKATGIDIFKNWMDIQSTLNLLASCQVLIGQKLHSLVFSASTYTPFISLEYRPKCLDFAELMGYKKYNVRIDYMTSKKVMELLHDLLANWDDMRNLLIEKVELYRERIRIFASKIIDDIESLPDDKWLPPSALMRIKNTLFYGPDRYCYHHPNKFFQAWSQLPIANRIARLKTKILS